MIRSTTAANTRAVDRLISRKACNCGQSLALERKIFDAKSHIVAAIVRLAEVASSPTSAAGLAVGDMRRALSSLESDE